MMIKKASMEDTKRAVLARKFTSHLDAMLLAQRLVDMHEEGLIGINFTKNVYDIAQGDGFTDWDKEKRERFEV